MRRGTAGEGTTWTFVPAATPWRVGLAERVVGLAKAALARQLVVGAILNYAQLETVVHRVASILNLRPLTARSFSEEDFYAVTPRDLLLGARPTSTPEEDVLRLAGELSAERLQREMEAVSERSFLES